MELNREFIQYLNDNCIPQSVLRFKTHENLETFKNKADILGADVWLNTQFSEPVLIGRFLHRQETVVYAETPFSLPDDCRNLFRGIQSFFSIDLSNFDTGNVTNMRGMFANFKADSLDLSSFDTGNVNDMTDLFMSLDMLKEVKLGIGFTVWKASPCATKAETASLA